MVGLEVSCPQAWRLTVAAAEAKLRSTLGARGATALGSWALKASFRARFVRRWGALVLERMARTLVRNIIIIVRQRGRSRRRVNQRAVGAGVEAGGEFLPPTDGRLKALGVGTKGRTNRCVVRAVR